jgi:putative colanic acid biosynthesis UDP-glucose lipid carrier transferase
MRKTLSSYLRLVFLLGDLLILNIAVISASYSFRITEVVSTGKLIYLLTLFNGLWLVLSFLINPYKFSRVSPFLKIIRIHTSFIFTYFLCIVSALFLYNSDFNPSHIVALIGITTGLLLLWRLFFIYLTKTIINKKLNFKNVVIVGYGDLAFDMRNFFRFHPEHGYRFLGYFDQTAKGRDVQNVEQLNDFCKSNNVQEIYCCLPYMDNNLVKQLTDFGLSNLIKVKLIIDYKGVFGRGLNLERYDQIPVLRVAAVPLDERYNQIIKRVFDIAFSGMVFLTVLSWLIPIIALFIKVDSKGPVFFRQKRAGKDNKPFDCMKFRTMHVHGEEFKQATKNDPRVTAVGKFLRKTSLDELPQFINVLMGQMSIIGPRPHPIKLNEQFSPRIEKFMARQYVKPGITGLAQAKGFRGETQTELSMKGRVKLDRFYIENWSFLLDLKIIVATVVSLAKGDQQAY